MKIMAKGGGVGESNWSAEQHITGDRVQLDPKQALLRLAFPAGIALTLLMFAPGWNVPGELRWVVIAAIAALAGLSLALRGATGTAPRLDRIDLAAFALLAWMAASLAWSADYRGGIETLAKAVALLTVFIALRHALDRQLAQWMALAVTVGLAAIIVLDRAGFAPWGGYYNQNFQTEALLLGLPFVAYLQASLPKGPLRYVPLALMVGAVAYMVLVNPSKIEFLSAAALAVYLLAEKGWRRHKAAVFVALAVLAALLLGFVLYFWDKPLLAGSAFRTSLFPRFELLVNTLTLWSDKGLSGILFGRGIGSFNALYPLYQGAHFEWLSKNVEIGLFAVKQMQAGAAHNEFVEFLSAFGLVGVAIVGWAAREGWRLAAVATADPLRRTGLFVLVLCLANALIEFPFQNPATALLAIVGLAWLLHPAAEQADATPPSGSADWRGGLLAIGGVAALIFLSWWGYRFHEGHAAYGLAIKSYATRPDIAFARNRESVVAYPYSPLHRGQLYVTLVRWEEVANKPVATAAAHDQLFADSLTAGPNTVVILSRLQNLYNTNRLDERKAEVARWRAHLMKNAPTTADVWLLEAAIAYRARDREGVARAVARYEALARGEVLEKQKAEFIRSLKAVLAG
jgi:hypothetical protein